MSADPQLRAMPFSIAGLCAASRSLYLNSALFAGAVRRRRLLTPVLQAATVGIYSAALKIGPKTLPVTAALSLKSP